MKRTQATSSIRSRSLAFQPWLGILTHKVVTSISAANRLPSTRVASPRMSRMPPTSFQGGDKWSHEARQRDRDFREEAHDATDSTGELLVAVNRKQESGHHANGRDAPTWVYTDDAFHPGSPFLTPWSDDQDVGYWMTSSARASTDGGMVSPRALAVFRL